MQRALEQQIQTCAGFTLLLLAQFSSTPAAVLYHLPQLLPPVTETGEAAFVEIVVSEDWSLPSTFRPSPTRRKPDSRNRGLSIFRSR